jgi:hypothetical protein
MPFQDKPTNAAAYRSTTARRGTREKVSHFRMYMAATDSLEVCQPVGHFAFTFNTCDTSLVTPQLNARRGPYARHIGHISAICHSYITPRLLAWPKYDIEGLQCQRFLGFPYLPLRSWRCRYVFALGRIFCLSDQGWET